MRVNPAIREYQKIADEPCNHDHWSGFREVPAAAEVWSAGRQGHDDPVELEPNVVAGPYTSIGDYLERHYLLLREDAVAPLRNAVSEVQAYPHILERDSREDAYVYERVSGSLSSTFFKILTQTGVLYGLYIHQFWHSGSCFLQSQAIGQKSQLGTVQTVTYWQYCCIDACERWSRSFSPPPASQTADLMSNQASSQFAALLLSLHALCPASSRTRRKLTSSSLRQTRLKLTLRSSG